MGICTSCLGLNRHPSQNNNETDALLNEQREQYGAIEATQPDEEELRREREALEQIAADATENMIDVSYRGTSELSRHFAHANSDDVARDEEEAEIDQEEAAWLQEAQAAGQDDLMAIDALQSGQMVSDVSQLRDDSAAASDDAKRSLKGRLTT